LVGTRICEEAELDFGLVIFRRIRKMENTENMQKVFKN
jgi:hypothetical protein